MLDKVGEVFDATVTNFLKGKLQSEETIKRILTVEDIKKLDPALKEMLADPVLGEFHRRPWQVYVY